LIDPTAPPDAPALAELLMKSTPRPSIGSVNKPIAVLSGLMLGFVGL